jgi:hypothetical protein
MKRLREGRYLRFSRRDAADTIAPERASEGRVEAKVHQD